MRLPLCATARAHFVKKHIEGLPEAFRGVDGWHCTQETTSFADQMFHKNNQDLFRHLV